MRQNGLRWTTAGAGLVLLLAATSSAKAQQRISDEHLKQIIVEAAARAGVTQTATGTLGQDTAAQPPMGARQVVRLTLDDAIKLALDRNLDIAVQRLNPQTYDYSLSSLQAAYRPIAAASISQQNATTPGTSTISGAGAGQGIVAGTSTFNGAVSQSLPWGGSNLVVAINNNRATTTSTTALFEPAFNTNWGATLTQPLLKNFRIDSNRQQIVVTRLNQDISEIQLQATIINTLSNVRNAYWDYVFAVQSVDVARQSVQLAEQLVKDNQARVEVGTMAPIDVIQAQSQAATQRQNLATVEGTQRTAELALKRLIVAGTQDANWNATLDPSNRPEFSPMTVDVEAAVRRALDTRTDLAQVRKNLQVNDVTLKYLGNQSLPQVDLAVNYALRGQGGTQYITTGSGINRQVLGTIPGGYGDALNTLFHSNYPTWSAALAVSYPIGTSAQDANLARARLQNNQVAAQLHQFELQVATDVTNAATQVQSNAERVQAAQAARELAQKRSEAEQSKFEVGMSTNYFVVQTQRDLATAQTNELQAILAYRKSVVELERLQQTSLTSMSVTLVGK